MCIVSVAHWKGSARAFPLDHIVTPITYSLGDRGLSCAVSVFVRIFLSVCQLWVYNSAKFISYTPFIPLYNAIVRDGYLSLWSYSLCNEKIFWQIVLLPAVILFCACFLFCFFVLQRHFLNLKSTVSPQFVWIWPVVYQRFWKNRLS